MIKSLKLKSLLFILSYLFLTSVGNQMSVYPKQINIEEKKDKIESSFYKDENNSILLQKDFYLIGPGDIVEMNLLDAQEFTGEYTVLNDGTISLPLVGSVNVNNLTIDNATKLIESKYSNQLLRPELHLIIKVPRPIRVSLIGEIDRPGMYSLTNSEESILDGGPQITNNGLPTIVDAIQKAGGITQNANLRKVTLLRRLPGREKQYKKVTLDLFDLIFKGDHDQNLFLFNGDIINVGKASKVSLNTIKIAQANLSPKIINVKVIGEVKTPGNLQLRANTPLLQAIYSAGGPIAWKSNKNQISLIRVNSNGRVIKKKFKINLNKSNSLQENPPLKDRDIVYVNSSNLNKLSEGLGAISEPIAPLITGLSLLKLLN